MRYKCLPALVGLAALALIPGDDAYGQRGGRGGAAVGGGRGGAVGGARGGAVGGARTGGAAVGPYGGAGAGSRSVGTVVGPAGGSRSAGTAGGSYTTGRGTTVNYGGAGRTATGPGGTTAGRGVGGVQVTTPGGRTATKVGAAGGIQGPGGATAVRGGSVGAASGPRGGAVSASRGGAAVGPGGAVGGAARAGVAVGPGGAVGGAARGTVAAGAYGGYASASRGVAVTGRAGHYTAYRGAAAVRTQAGYVRTGFAGYHYFNPGWYTAHPGAWRAAAWTGATFWRWAPYATVATFCGYAAQPIVYDYGSTVVYQDNSVYYNGEPVATAEEYATQATSFAARGEAAKVSDQEEWQPLGVFAMVQGEEKEATDVFQLAINKDGVIRGNYTNTLTDTSLPVLGSVDKKTQRVAWTVGSNKGTVYETGLGNLTQPETEMLVHVGKERTQQRTLVRMEPPPEMK